MENIIDIYDEEGNKFKAEVLDIFSLDKYENKNYIVYTRNVAVDEDNIEVYVSILDKKDNEYHLATITDEEEWNDVQKAMEEEGF